MYAITKSGKAVKGYRSKYKRGNTPAAINYNMRRMVQREHFTPSQAIKMAFRIAGRKVPKNTL